MFKLAPAFALFVLLALFAAPVSAFTPDDQELAMVIQKEYGALTSWEAEMTFPDYPGTSVHIWYARGKWRQEWKAGDIAKAVGVNDSVVAACTPGKFPVSPLFVWMPPNPVEAWKSWGVDNATSVYGFCDDNPCYMLGADSLDTMLPAVYLHNEDVSPLQLRYNSGLGSTQVEFSEYKTLGGFRVPQKVAVTTGGALLLTAQVKWIAVNRADDEMLYDRDSLESAPCATPPPPFDILLQGFRYPAAQ